MRWLPKLLFLGDFKRSDCTACGEYTRSRYYVLVPHTHVQMLRCHAYKIVAFGGNMG